ncbi:MAG: AMP-binding protein [Pseudomonadales bacterium]|nr:AMP-binding protein [Pseudomonadales bacterium]
MTLLSSIDHAKQFMEVGRDIPTLLASWVSRTPDKPFLIWEPFSGESKTWTYQTFSDDINSLASSLSKRGVKQGDAVLIHMENSPEFLLSWFSCALLGAIAVSTNTRSVARDMTYFSDHAEVVCALTQPQFATLVSESAPNLLFLAVTDNNAGEQATTPAGIEHIPFSELLQETDPCPTREVSPMADLGIQFTSGTTSRPKAVLWTHANAIWGAHMNAMHFRLRQTDTTLIVLPLFHTNAQSYSMLASLWVGGTIVLQPKFSASRFWDVSVRNQCTWVSLIPFCVKAILRQAVPDTHAYQMWITAVQLDSVEKAVGVRTVGLWGMTETITHGIVTDPHQPSPNMSIGRASPGYDIAVRNEKGDLILPGERGRLYIRGTRGVSLFKEYYKNAEANASSFDEGGWFDTGDLVRMGEAGELYFSDRDKDMLKVGAENVAASEVEAVIMETGLVGECAVVGQQHFMLDEVPVVFLIPREPGIENIESKIIDACRKNLPDFKVVRSVFIVDDFPRSTLEKIAKKELRDRLEKITE